MSKVKLDIIGKPLIQDDGYYVMVSHRELDDLIGRMMMLFELNGDVEQRNALKQEFKWRARSWLDDIYKQSGYDSLVDGVDENAHIINVEEARLYVKD